MAYTIIHYRARDGSCPYNEFRQLLQRSGARAVLENVDSTLLMLVKEGLALLGTNRMDNIEDDIYELRVRGYRLFCFLDRRNNAFVILNGFLKATRRTPESEKATARSLVNSYLATRGD